MSEVRISAEPRTEFGKGGARRTRRAGKVPAVLYGHGEKPKHIALPAREFAAAIRHGGTNQVFDIEVSDGTRALALPKAIQRDPIKDTFEHVDLLIVRRGEKVTVDVPVILIGEAARDTLVMHEHGQAVGDSPTRPGCPRTWRLRSRASRRAARSPPATSPCPRASSWPPTRTWWSRSWPPRRPRRRWRARCRRPPRRRKPRPRRRPSRPEVPHNRGEARVRPAPLA